MYRPKKSLGQNFLKDKNIAQKIVNLLEFSEDRYILEIGPGKGIITEFLLSRTDRVILIDIDSRSINYLKSRFGTKDYPNIFFKNEDILKVNLFDLSSRFGVKTFDVIGNIPYFITGEIFKWLLKNNNLIHSAVLTVQSEVAQRVVAIPRNKDYGILSIATQIYSTPELKFNISPRCFYPIPKVKSSTILLKLDKKPDELTNSEDIIEIAKYCFNQRRKKLKNSIQRYLELKNLNKEQFYNFVGKFETNELLDKRAEELSINDYRRLFELIQMLGRKIDE